MKRISEIIILIILIVCPFTLSAQEIVSGLQGNVIAERYYSNSPDSKKAGFPSDTVELPFTDDFSDSYVRPKTSLWSDKYAFINSTYAVNPPSVGVATMDALNYNGSQYPSANSNPYQADFLTSQPINLNYNASDSLYLSFYFQPAGLAWPPDIGDSLLLDFFRIDSLKWEKVWSAPGTGTTGNFKRVLIKIEDPGYLKKGFRFRFRNYASQLANNDLVDKRANVDIWNIDYVKLDRNRSIADTILRDVSFIEPINSILKDYISLPWSHFSAAYNTQRAPYIGVVIQNHDSITRNVGTVLEIRDVLRPKAVYKVPVFNNDLLSGDSIHYKYSYNYPFDFANYDSAAFEIKTILQTDLFDYKSNDTLKHLQKFYDYYSLDDGTAEASYGLRGSGTKDASSALKFNSFTGDSLRAIDLYFVQLVDSVNLDYYFYLSVWGDNNGKPGTKIVNQVGMRPAYSGELNKFVRYYLETPVYIEGTFYIGFTQTVEKLLNIGLDLNRSNKPRIFNDTNNGIWETTVLLPGTPMMRPVFRQNPFTGTPVEMTFPFLSAWPNPSSEFLNISINDNFNQSKTISLNLYDISGRIIRKIDPWTEKSISTRDFSNGMYFLRYVDPVSKQNSTIKIIISH